MNPETLKVIGECIGAAAIAEGFLIYFSKTRGRILAFKFISDLLWFFNMLCLGNFTGALLNIVAMCREVVFSLAERRKLFACRIWLAVFLVATAVSPVYSLITGNEGAAAVFPTLGSLLAVIAFYQKDPKYIRSIGFVAQALWLVYALLSNNISSTAGNSILIISAISGSVRAALDKKKSQNHPAE